MLKLFSNKKAQTLFNVYIYYIMTAFGLAILSYFVIEIGVIGYVLPVLKNVVVTGPIDSATQGTILTNYDKIKFFLRILPFALWTGVTIYLLIRLIIRESDANEP